MLRLIYTVIYYLCAPLLCLRWVYKSFKPPQYREPMRERFGFVKPQSAPSIWFHAVSMGESNAAKEIINALLGKNPELNIVVTTTTPTGARQIIEGLGDKVTHHYSPCDLPGAIKRFVKRINPEVLVIMETELWPNWLYHMKANKIPVILANARMSEKSVGKYLKIRSLSTQMMSALQRVLPVGEKDAERFLRMGVKPENVVVTGNIKFDQCFSSNGQQPYFPMWESSEEHNLVWIAASTHKGEDELILQAHQAILKELPQAKLIIVPRHPERFDAVACLIESYDLSYCRRSQPENWATDAQVLLGDTMGELMLAYQLADIAFVAGSLEPIGGHNMIEPASLGKPVLSGPYVHNFNEVYLALAARGGAKQVTSVDDISNTVVELMQKTDVRDAMGNEALAVVEESKGALAKTIAELQPFLPE